MAIRGHRVNPTQPQAGDVVLGKSVPAAIGVRPCSVSLAMRRGKMRQSRMTCNRRHSVKIPVVMAVVEEAAPVVVHPARAAHAEASVKVTLAAAVADQLSRAAAIVLPDPTIRRVALSRTR